MQSIDFLPYSYRDRDQFRRSRTWRSGILLAAGGLLCLITLTQVAIRRQLKQQLTELEAPAVQASMHEQHVLILRSELALEIELAELYNYLRHPWPRTQILAEILRRWPTDMSLTELRLHREQVSLDSAPRMTANAEADKGISAAAADLKRLRDDNDPRRLIVMLEGLAQPSADLHAFVANVQSSPLVAGAELVSLEANDQPDQLAMTRFRIRVIIIPGFGHEKGPTKLHAVQTADLSPQPLVTRYVSEDLSTKPSDGTASLTRRVTMSSKDRWLAPQPLVTRYVSEDLSTQPSNDAASLTRRVTTGSTDRLRFSPYCDQLELTSHP